MSTPTWRFKERQRNDTHQDPANTEFFAQQDVAERLMREAAQNTMDASRDGTARLVFTLTEVPNTLWKQYFGALWPHLEANDKLKDHLPNQNSSIPCLLVEDFGTTGLTGPLEPDTDEVRPDEKSHRLYWFFKNVGRTSKTGEHLGSFGIGKTVFPYSSRISTIFGLSVRDHQEGEPRTILVGFSQLLEHRIANSHVFTPYGYYAWQDGDKADYEQRPISEPMLLDGFRTQFGLLREPDQTGLSVVIPYPVENLSRIDLTKAAIDHFFYPILSGQLTIEIREGSYACELSKSKLIDEVNKLDLSEGEKRILLKKLYLAIWSLGDGRTNTALLGRPSSSSQPKFDNEMITASQRAELSLKFISGERISVRVPVPVEPKGKKDPIWSYIDIFLEYDREGTSKEDLYVRRGLTLIEHCGLAKHLGLRSILIAEDPPIYEMLRASENVAHTEWRRRNANKLSQEYDRGPSKVVYVLGIVPGLIQSLLSPEDEADWFTLADLFPEAQSSPLKEVPIHPNATGEQVGVPVQNEPTEEEDETPSPLQLEITRPTRQWRLKATRTGLRIEGNPEYVGELKPMEFTAAYGTLSGSKLKNHHPYDFSFKSDDMIIAQDARFEVLDDNLILITPVSNAFAVEIDGFDAKRAVDYRIAVKEGE